MCAAQFAGNRSHPLTQVGIGLPGLRDYGRRSLGPDSPFSECLITRSIVDCSVTDGNHLRTLCRKDSSNHDNTSIVSVARTDRRLEDQSVLGAINR